MSDTGLREKLIEILEAEFCGTLNLSALADRILAIPEITEALKAAEDGCQVCQSEFQISAPRTPETSATSAS